MTTSTTVGHAIWKHRLLLGSIGAVGAGYLLRSWFSSDAQTKSSYAKPSGASDSHSTALSVCKTVERTCGVDLLDLLVSFRMWARSLHSVEKEKREKFPAIIADYWVSSIDLPAWCSSGTQVDRFSYTGRMYMFSSKDELTVLTISGNPDVPEERDTIILVGPRMEPSRVKNLGMVVSMAIHDHFSSQPTDLMSVTYTPANCTDEDMDADLTSAVNFTTGSDESDTIQASVCESASPDYQYVVDNFRRVDLEMLRKYPQVVGRLLRVQYGYADTQVEQDKLKQYYSQYHPTSSRHTLTVFDKNANMHILRNDDWSFALGEGGYEWTRNVASSTSSSSSSPTLTELD